MKVIVFGGSGFVGSHVADALTKKGYDITIYDLKLSPHLLKSQKMVVGDIMDESKVNKTVQASDVVYNFAGIADIEEASRKPLDTIRYNIIGNSIILEACRKAKINRFVFASSLYVYSKTGSFYRSAKQACELLTENYNEVYDLPYTILRYGSLYGPRANENNFIYKILKQAFVERKITREGDGEEIREYIHVYDAARGSVEILSDEFVNQHIMITGNQQMKVKDFLVMVKEMFDNKIEIKHVPPSSSYHYKITPYTFVPQIARRLVSKDYVDLGQGILKCIQGIHKEVDLDFPSKKESPRK